MTRNRVRDQGRRSSVPVLSTGSSSIALVPTPLHEHPNRVAMTPPFELCESCLGREGKLIDTRYGRGGFLVCEPCYGPMTLVDWMLA